MCICILTGEEVGGTICIGGRTFYICVCVSVGGWGRGWVSVFVCQINYLNPVAIKAEICYQHTPLVACVSALLPQYALHLLPPSGLSVGLDKDHKLWILNTHPSITKTNCARLWPRDLLKTLNIFIPGANECCDSGSFWCNILIKCYLCLKRHGMFNLHNDVVSLRWCVIWGWKVWSVSNWGCLLRHHRCFSGEGVMAVHDGITGGALSSLLLPLFNFHCLFPFCPIIPPLTAILSLFPFYLSHSPLSLHVFYC